MIGTFEEMWRDMEAGVFDYTVAGHCSNCGSCCSNILPISPQEILRIKLYIKKNQIKEQVCNYPADPGYSKERRRRRRSGNHCLIKC